MKKSLFPHGPIGSLDCISIALQQGGFSCVSSGEFPSDVPGYVDVGYGTVDSIVGWWAGQISMNPTKNFSENDLSKMNR